MPEHSIARAKRSIHHVHELIHMVFTRPASETQAVLGGLMAVFAEEFSMVGTQGKVLGRQHVEQLFRGQPGARPGLEIVLSEVQVVWQAAATVAVRYKETHRLEGVETARWSLAILECAGQGVVWRYLHETAIAQ